MNKKKYVRRLVYFGPRRGQHIKQGGLSDALWNNKILKGYRKSSLVAGYVGAFDRTIKWDKYIESELRKRGMGSNAIATWMTSTSGRHMMDNPYKSNIDEYMKTIPIEAAMFTDKAYDKLGNESWKYLFYYYKNKKHLKKQLNEVL